MNFQTRGAKRSTLSPSSPAYLWFPPTHDLPSIIMEGKKKSPPISKGLEATELSKLRDRYSALISFSLDENMKLSTTVDTLRRKHEVALPRTIGIDLLARAKLILREEISTYSTSNADNFSKSRAHSATFLPNAPETERKGGNKSPHPHAATAYPRSDIATASAQDRVPKWATSGAAHSSSSAAVGNSSTASVQSSAPLHVKGAVPSSQTHIQFQLQTEKMARLMKIIPPQTSSIPLTLSNWKAKIMAL